MKKQKRMILCILSLCAVCFVVGIALFTDRSACPRDFAIRYETRTGANANIFDTGEGFIQKDLVLDGTAKTEFTPDPALLERIWQEVRRDRMMNIRGYVEGAAADPSTQYSITITANGKTYTIGGRNPAGSAKRDAVRLLRFSRFMNELIESLPEYQTMPDARGGYT